MFEWLKNANQNLVTVATAVIALVLTVIVARYAMIPYHAAKREKRILDTRTWDGILSGLQTDRAARYFGAIEASVGWFDRVYGPKLISYRAFDRALWFAFVYAILTLLIGWAMFDAGQLGGVAFMPEGLPFWGRMAALAAFALNVLIYLRVFQFARQLSSSTSLHLKKSIYQTKRKVRVVAYLRRTTYRVADRCIGFLVFPFGLLIALFFNLGSATVFGVFAGMFYNQTGPQVLAQALALATVYTFALLPALALALTFSFIGAFAVAVTGGLIVFVAGSSASRFPFFYISTIEFNDLQFVFFITLLLFLLILPLLNALADFLSIAATRSFLRRIAAQRKTAVQVLVGVGIDLVVAALCLGLLLGSIIVTLDLWRDLAPATLPFDWRAYRDTLCAGDWQRGTMLWLMLSTTLAPTALHLAAGFGAVFAHSGQIDEKIAAILRPARDALVAKYGAEVLETKQKDLAETILDADQCQSLNDLLGHKEGAQRWLTVALFIGFMVLMMGAVILAAHQFALPQLCPGL